MAVVHLLRELPDIAVRVGPRGEPESWLRDQVDDFVRRQEVARIEIEPALSPPDDDLPDGESVDDVVPILQEAALNAPFVVVEDRPVILDHPEHFRQARALPLNVLIMRHRIAVVGVSIYERRPRPFAASPVFHAVAGGVLQVIRGGSDDQIHAAFWELAQGFQAIATYDFINKSIYMFHEIKV